MATDETKHTVNAGRVTAGLVVLALGALMLLDRHDIVGHDTMRFFPGVIVMILGAVKILTDDGRRGGRRAGFGGVWLLFVGAWLIVNEGNLMGLRYRDSWPLLIIGAGVMIVARELFGARGTRAADSDQSRGRQ